MLLKNTVTILPLSKRQKHYLEKHDLIAIFEKQSALFEQNPRHPSLHTEILEPKHLHIYSFRVTRSVRAMFVYCGNETIEIVDINHHYND